MRPQTQPLAAGKLAQPGGLMDQVAERTGGTHAQVALAWLLRKSPVMLPIPGTGKVRHLEENMGGAALELSEEDFLALDQAGAAAWEAERLG
jgi:pyridoxine 4-dehydrogenase